jgi:hypothetical protein
MNTAIGSSTMAVFLFMKGKIISKEDEEKGGRIFFIEYRLRKN